MTQDDCKQLENWFKTSLGQLLLQDEEAELSKIITHYFGYHLLHGGAINYSESLSLSPIRHKVYLELHPSSVSPLKGMVKTNIHHLPFLEGSIDLAILSHVLEFEKSPEAVLKEITYTLIPNGYLIIFGFNPYSLWSFYGKLFKRHSLPWKGKFLSVRQLRSWLKENHCIIDDYKTFSFDLPIENQKMRENFSLIKSIGKTCWPTNGAVYCLIARKEIATLTPVQIPWRRQGVPLSKKQAVEPTTRNF